MGGPHIQNDSALTSALRSEASSLCQIAQASERGSAWEQGKKPITVEIAAALTPERQLDQIRNGERTEYIGLGSRGSAVRWLKDQLNTWAQQKGLNVSLEQNDLMDREAVRLLRKFQGCYGLTSNASGLEETARGLRQDGIFGVRTARVLDLVMGRSEKLIDTGAFIEVTHNRFRYSDYTSEFDTVSGDSRQRAGDRRPISKTVEGLRQPVLEACELAKVEQVAAALGTDPKWILAAMSFETGGALRPDCKNSSSGATGLIQFMPETARSLGTSCADLAGMSRLAQLDYVHKYLRPFAGKLDSLEDVYTAILWPAAVGKSGDTVLMTSGRNAYSLNQGLDHDGNGAITKSEACAKVREHFRSLFG